MKRYDIDFIDGGVDRFYGVGSQPTNPWLIIYDKDTEMSTILSAYTIKHIKITELNEKV